MGMAFYYAMKSDGCIGWALQVIMNCGGQRENEIQT